MVQELRLRQVQKVTLKPKLIGRLKMAKLMETSEIDFHSLVKEVESDSLFQKLLIYKGVRHRRFLGVSPAFFRKVTLDENRISSRSEETFSLDEKTKELIEKIGQEKFTYFFLAPEKVFTLKEVMAECGLRKEEVEKIVDLVNNFSFSSFSYKPDPRPTRRLSIIAGIQKDGEKLSISDFTLDLVKGEYIIDESGVNQLKSSLSPKERRKVDKIITRLKWFNSRRSTIYSILHALLQKQRAFFLSGDWSDLVGLTQRQISQELNLDSSLLNRAIKERAVKSPEEIIIPLKSLFPGHKEEIKKAINEILTTYQEGDISDNRIGQILRRDYQISISRRTVNHYRHL